MTILFVNLMDFLARILISAIFIFSGINKFLNYDATIQWMEGYSLHGIFLMPTIVLEIILSISTSVLLGIDRTRAAKFSFLMVVPLIFGKIVKDLLSGDLNLQSSEIIPILIGFISAFISGLLACKWMILIVKRSKLSYFSIYCAIIGSVAIVYALLN